MNFPSIRPTRTPAIVLPNGTSETAMAAEVPLRASMSVSFCWSWEITKLMHCVSPLKSSGKSGRMGRSIIREDSVSFSEGRPSRRKKLPGILPAEYDFSRYSTVNGKKSKPGLISGMAQIVEITMESPYWTVTAPLACLAILPVSIIIVRPPRSNSILCGM